MSLQHTPWRPAWAPLARAVALAAALPLLASCATLTPARALDDVQALAAAPIGAPARDDDPATDAATAAGRAAMLDAPLTRDAAVAMAMARNPRLQVAYARLGIGAAEAFEASRLSNPRISASRLSGGGGTQRTLSLGLSLADLLLLPQSRRLATRDYEALRIEIAARAVTAARDTESAWYRHVAASQHAELRAAVAEAAEASAALAQRYATAGTISRLQLLRERAASAEARVAALDARAAAITVRQALNAQMGLSGDDADRWQAPERLPMPVAGHTDLATALALADDARLDLRAARLQLGILADGVAVSRGWRWLGGLDLDYEWEREPDGSRMRGPGLTLELPVFHQGQARVMRADARLQRGGAELAQRELEVALGVREAAGRVDAAAEIVAAYSAGIVPDRAEAVARELERYNFMLIGAFELLAARQAEYAAYAGLINAVRDYWLARTDLAHAVGTRLPGDDGGDALTPDLQPLLAPATAATGGHDRHGAAPAPAPATSPDHDAEHDAATPAHGDTP